MVVKKQKGYVVIDKNDKEVSKYVDSDLVIKNFNDYYKLSRNSIIIR